MNGVLAEIGRIEPLVRVLWGGVALLALALVTLLVILEGRHFRGRGLARPWAWLRAASLPCLAAALLGAFAVGRASGVSGMEALAVHYGALFTVAPLLYFAAHAVLGRLLGLASPVALWIGVSGLCIAAVPVAVFSLAQPWVHPASRALREQRFARLPEAAPAHLPVARALVLDEATVLHAIAWQAAPATRVIRVDSVGASGVERDVLINLPDWLCRDGDDLHVLLPAGRPLPELRVYWEAADGRRWRSTLPPPPAFRREPWTLLWHGDALTLPGPLPPDLLAVDYRNGDGRPFLRPLAPAGPGGHCAPRRLHLPALPDGRAASALQLRIYVPPAPPRWVTFARP